MQCEEWADANSQLFKEAHDEAVHKNSYKRKFYELISASQGATRIKKGLPFVCPTGMELPERAEEHRIF